MQPRGNFTIILSRTDSIGDVVLTLPMAGVIKNHFPKCRIIFLGRNYTRDVVALSMHVDEFISYDELQGMDEAAQVEFVKQLEADYIVHVFPVKEIAKLAKKAGIPTRIGTTNRLYHWFSCNKLVALSRKNSPLHEAQLNVELLSSLNVPTNILLAEIPEFYGFTKLPETNTVAHSLIDPAKTNVILHPRSKGSAREWGLDNFSELVQLLPESNYKIFVSGTKEEGEQIRSFIEQHPQVNDITGKLSLREFIGFINSADALVAASTGPLHIAAALGKKAVGLYAPMRPIHPGRWRPVGRKARYLVLNKNCSDCRKSRDCQCIRDISPEQVVDLLEKK
ncbi:MAG: glycosyltransferase family 9 protein [Bacteroidia bacterium]